MIYPDRRKEILTGVFIFTLLFGGCGLGELTLRAINYERFGTTKIADPATPDENIGFLAVEPETGIQRPTPGFNGSGIHINELGLRGPSLAVPKPPTEIRLAFVGGSTTFDIYAGSNETTFPSVTRNLLKATYPSCHIDYANAGFPGLTLPQYDIVLDRDVAPLTPDLVILFPSVLTSEMRRIAHEQGWSPEVVEKPSYLEQFSMLWQAVGKNSRFIKRQRKALRPDEKVSIDPDEFGAYYEKRLEALIRHAQSLGSIVVLIEQSGQLQRQESHSEQMAVAEDAFEFMPFLSLDALLDLYDAVGAATVRAAKKTGVILVQPLIPGDSAYWQDYLHFRRVRWTALGSGCRANPIECSPLPDLSQRTGQHMPSSVKA